MFRHIFIIDILGKNITYTAGTISIQIVFNCKTILLDTYIGFYNNLGLSKYINDELVIIYKTYSHEQCALISYHPITVYIRKIKLRLHYDSRITY